MPKIRPFEQFTERYEAWFDEHPAVFRSELAALRAVCDPPHPGLEIGVGSGQFAAPLGLQYGIDPSPSMLGRAGQRGIRVLLAVAEALPFSDATFNLALIVTTICFVDDVGLTLREARRVLTPGGRLVIGYIDSSSPLGKHYRENRERNPFYREATFVSTEELVVALRQSGFEDVAFRQTLFRPLEEIDRPEPVRDGHDRGSFVVIRAS